MKPLLPMTAAGLIAGLTMLQTITADPAKPACPDSAALRYNNPDLTVDLGVGLWGIPLPVDYDGDGLKDLLVSCPDRPYKGLYFFKNIGTPRHPHFAAAVRISERG